MVGIFWTLTVFSQPSRSISVVKKSYGLSNKCKVMKQVLNKKNDNIWNVLFPLDAQQITPACGFTLNNGFLYKGYNKTSLNNAHVGIKMFHLISRTMLNARVFSITLYTAVTLPVLKLVGVLFSAILVVPPCGH